MNFICLFISLLIFSGCGAGMIKGTKLRATSKNQAVYAVVLKYRDVIRKGQWEDLMKMISPHFHETRGTSDPEDDYGFEELREHLQSEEFRKVKVLNFSMKVEKIDYPKENQAKVYLKTWHSFRYPRGKYRPGFDAGPKRQLLVFEFLQGRWKILRGI